MHIFNNHNTQAYKPAITSIQVGNRTIEAHTINWIYFCNIWEHAWTDFDMHQTNLLQNIIWYVRENLSNGDDATSSQILIEKIQVTGWLLLGSHLYTIRIYVNSLDHLEPTRINHSVQECTISAHLDFSWPKPYPSLPSRIKKLLLNIVSKR